MMPPPPLSSSSKRKGLVNPRGMMLHSIDRYGPDIDIDIANKHTTNVKQTPTSETLRSPITNDTTRRVEQFYDIRDVLGSGTCGEVRRAICRRTGELVAIKVIDLGGRNRGAKLSKEHTDALKAEAQILQRLDHPYIIRLHDVFVHPDVAIYLVMELMEGGDLFDRIVKKGKYSEDDARRTMRRLLNALHYLHVRKNIVHRDLKPENILCINKNSDIDVKLTDFGLAKTISNDGLRSFVGTPQYFAPEVLQRRYTVAGKGRYGREADMWSLGVIMYILLSGIPPFDVSDNNFDVVVDAKIKFPRKLWTAVSAEAKNLVTRLLEQDPSKRISVEAACKHKWFYMRDSDSHRNPLSDPAAPMNRGSPTLNPAAVVPTVPVFNQKVVSRRLFQDVDDTEKQPASTPRADTQQSTNTSSPQREQQQQSPVASKSPDHYSKDGTKAAVVVSTEKNEPTPPRVDLQHNHFRRIIQKSHINSKVPPAPPNDVSGLSDRNAVTPSSRTAFRKPKSTTQKRENRKKQKQPKGKIKPSELSDDGICSEFSDDDDSSLSASRTVSSSTTNESAKTKTSSSQEDSKKSESKPIFASTVKKRKRSSTAAKAAQDGKKNEHRSESHPVADYKTTDAHHEAEEKIKAKRQTTLSNWFQKKEHPKGNPS